MSHSNGHPNCRCVLQVYDSFVYDMPMLADADFNPSMAAADAAAETMDHREFCGCLRCALATFSRALVWMEVYEHVKGSGDGEFSPGVDA